MREKAALTILGFFLWTGTCLGATNADALNPGLSASLVPETARVGSVVSLTLTYHLPDGASIPPDTEIGGLEGITLIDRQAKPGEFRIRLLVDRLGPWKTDPLSLTYLDKAGKRQVLIADPVKLTVVSNLGEKPEETQLKPIYGIIPTTTSWPRYLVYTTLGLAAFLAAFALFWWYRRRGIRKGSIISQDPPHILAKKNLESLEAKGLFETGYVKEYYFRFSEILRQYLEALRGFPAAEYTTPEIALRIHKEPDQRLLPLLREADLVKFADVIPTRARKEEEIEVALSYIRDTGSDFESDLSPDKQPLKGILGQEEGTR